VVASLLASLGRGSIAFAEFVGGVAELLYRSTYWAVVGPLRGKPLRGRATLRQMVVVGFDAVPIVFLISMFVGIIIALQGAYSLKQYGALNFVVNMVAITITRELGPLLTAIIVIGRSGSAFAAELGTMKVGEELDALETMGLDPIHFLVVPKYLAMLVMMPCLTTIADTAGILGGALFAMSNLHWSLSNYLLRTADALVMRDIVTGLIKSLVFAVIITKVGCYEGFSVQGGAEGVGRSTTASVVKSIFSVIAADMISTALFYYASAS
jgi:phospholipid/cholesterol/gamma-HCH transport system permease protein